MNRRRAFLPSRRVQEPGSRQFDACRAPVMQAEIRHALERDRVLYNAVGFELGFGVAGRASC